MPWSSTILLFLLNCLRPTGSSIDVSRLKLGSLYIAVSRTGLKIEPGSYRSVSDTLR